MIGERDGERCVGSPAAGARGTRVGATSVPPPLHPSKSRDDQQICSDVGKVVSLLPSASATARGQPNSHGDCRTTLSSRLVRWSTHGSKDKNLISSSTLALQIYYLYPIPHARSDIKDVRVTGYPTVICSPPRNSVCITKLPL